MSLNRKHVSALFIAAMVAVGSSGCSAAAYIFAMNKSTDQFLTSASDPRVKYEPGAELQAQLVAQILPVAILTIEQEQYRRFDAPVNVYVCASAESFEAYTNSGGAGGAVLNKRLFISPKPQNTAVRLPGVLTHELSHLHLGQRMGLLKTTRIPSWFMEGLAVFVANSTGAETVTEEEARVAIRQGKYFHPETEGGFVPRRAHDYGLDPHMFYRQAGMFVAYLRQLDDKKFRAFLLAVEDGEPFASAFVSAYNLDIDAAWQHFVIEMQEPGPEST